MKFKRLGEAVDILTPEWIKAPFRGISKETAWVKEQKVGELPELKGAFLSPTNSAIWMGKLLEPRFAARMKRALNGKNKDEEEDGPVYSREFIEMALAYAFEHTSKGQVVNFVLCRELSELCNGPEDVEGYLSNEDHLLFLYEIARKEFPTDAERLAVYSVDRDHPKLFKQLRKINSAGTVDIPALKAMTVSELGEQPDSLRIAQILLAASDECDALRNEIQDAVPEKLQERPAGSPGLSSKEAYALFEVAIRLAELLQGKTFQIGASRQGPYNKIFTNIMKGEKGPYKDSTTLKSLFQLLKGKSFCGVNVNKRNYYSMIAERSRARVRLVLLGGLLGLGAAGGAEYVEHVKQTKEAEITKALELDTKLILADRICFWDGPFLQRNPQDMVDGFNIASDSAMDTLIHRYNVPSEVAEHVFQGLWESDVLNGNGDLCDLLNQKSTTLADSVDDFVWRRARLFREQGLNLSRPYSHLPFLEDFARHGNPQTGPEELTSAGDRLGTYVSTYQFGQLYIFKHDSVLYGQIPYESPRYERRRVFPVVNLPDADFPIRRRYGDEIVEDYKQAQRRFDGIEIRRFLDTNPDLKISCDKGTVREPKDYPDFSIDEKHIYPTDKRFTYTDHFGEFDYDLVVYRPSGSEDRYFYAREGTGRTFTTEKGWVAMQTYCRYQDEPSQ